jgi:hypothetical protein
MPDDGIELRLFRTPVERPYVLSSVLRERLRRSLELCKATPAHSGRHPCVYDLLV